MFKNKVFVWPHVILLLEHTTGKGTGEKWGITESPTGPECSTDHFRCSRCLVQSVTHYQQQQSELPVSSYTSCDADSDHHSTDQQQPRRHRAQLH